MAARKLRSSHVLVFFGPQPKRKRVGNPRIEPGDLKKGRSAGLPSALDADVDETAANIADARRVCSVHMHNTHNAVVYLQIFAAPSPTVGTTVPRLVIPLAPGANNITLPSDGVAVATSTGIALACTAGASNGTAPGATVLGMITYR